MEEKTEKKGDLWLIPTNPWAVLFQGICILALGIVLVVWQIGRASCRERV